MPIRITEQRKRFAVALATALLFIVTAFWFVATVVIPSAGRMSHGFGAYYSASRLLSTGEYSAGIYDADFFRSQVRKDSQDQVEDIWGNPPPAALLLWPFSFFDHPQARTLWTWLNVALLFAGLGLLVWGFLREKRVLFLLLVWTIGMLFRPVIANFYFGQAYLFIFLLLGISAVAYYRQKDGYGGVSLAMAASLKAVGWPILFLLILQKRWKYLAWFGGGALALILLTLPLFSFESWRRFFLVLNELTNSPLVCSTAYQTTRSWLCHLFAPQVDWQSAQSLDLPWTALALFFILAVGTLVLTLRISRTKSMTAFVALIVWGILFAPLGEAYHQTVVLIAVVWLLVQWGSGQRIGRWTKGLLIASLLLYIIPFPLNDPNLQTGFRALLAYPRLFGAWMVWMALIVLREFENN